MPRTILQRGAPCADLALYLHIAADLIRARVAQTTQDAFVVELAGSGTSSYQGLIAKAGGWRPYVTGLAAEVGHPFQRTACIAWSAGGRAAEEACASEDVPDAVVLLDALYGFKPTGSSPGDGKIVTTPGLEAVARYALRAARGETTVRGPLACVLMHSGIATPYASSRECVTFIQRYVEMELGHKLRPAEGLGAKDLDGHAFESAFQWGNLQILAFKGNTGGEHVLEAHLWDEVCKLWVPWLLESSCAAPARPAPPEPEDLRLIGPPRRRGKDVESWQAFLRATGIAIEVDGIYGPQTAGGTRAFQHAAGIAETGTVNEATFLLALKAGFLPPSGGPPPNAPVVMPLGAATLAEAELDLAAGVRETARNDGPAIREYLAHFWLDPGSNWCSAALAAWMQRAAQRIGKAPPIKGSPGARATMEQFKAVPGRWLSAAELRANPALVQPGMVPVWDRSVAGNSAAAWWGHIGIVEAIQGDAFTTIEGNSGPNGDRVARMTRQLFDPRLFGMGVLD